MNQRKFGDCGAYAADLEHTDHYCRFGSLESQGLEQMKWKVIFGLAKPFRPRTLSVEWPNRSVFQGESVEFRGRESSILNSEELAGLVRAALPARLLTARAYVQFKASADGFFVDNFTRSFRGDAIGQALGEGERARYNADIDFRALVLSRAVLFLFRVRGSARNVDAERGVEGGGKV